MDIQLVKTYAKNYAGGIKKLAFDIGMTEANLHRCINNNKIQASHLEAIASLLGVPVTVFFAPPTAGGGDSAGRDVNKGNARVLNIEHLSTDQLNKVSELMNDGGEGKGVTEEGVALRADADTTDTELAQLRTENARLRQENASLRQENDRLNADLAKARDKIDQLNDQLNKAHTELLQFYRKG